jgi:hypothetical protein
MFKELFVVLSAKISGFIKGIKEVLGITAGARKQINAAAAEMGDAFENVFSTGLRDNIANLSDSISVNRDRIVQLKEELKSLQAELKKQKSGTQEFKNTERAIRRVQKGIFDTTQDLAKFNIAARDQKSALASSRLAAEDNSAAIEATSRAVNAATGALLLFGEGNETLKPVLKGVGIALGLVNVAIVFQNLRLRENAVFARAVTVAQGALRTAFVGTTAAATATKTVLSSLGIGLAIAGIVTLTSSLIDAANASNAAAETQKKFNDSYSSFGGSELTKVNLLIAQINDLSLSIDTRKAALKSLQGIFPAYFSNLNDEKILSGQVRIETSKLTDAILKNAKARAIAERIGDISTDILKKEKLLATSQERLVSIQKKLNGEFENVSSSQFYSLGLIRTQEAVNQLKKEIQDLTTESENYAKQIATINQETDPIMGAAPDEPKKVKVIKAKTEKVLKDFVVSQEKLAILESQLNTQRALALATSEEKRAEIINAGEQEILNIRKQFAPQLPAIDAKSQQEGLEAYAKYKLDVLEAETKGNKALEDARNKDNDKIIEISQSQAEAIVEAQEGTLAVYERFYNEEIGLAAERYNKGEIDLDLYNQQIKDLTLEGLQARLMLLKSFGLSTAEVEKQIADFSLKTTKDTADERNKLLEQANRTIQNSFETLFNDLATSFGEFLATTDTNENPLEKLFGGILGSVAGFMDALGKSIVAIGIAKLQLDAALVSFSGPAAIAAGFALIAAGAATKSIAAQGFSAFADGGIVSGPTLGLVGEYPGASTNPEVIAPLNKLKNLIGNTGDGTAFIAETRVSGRDLAIVFNKYNKDNQRG